MDILWLGQRECQDARLVGGKAANLSLLAADHRVPSGFCLTTEVFGRWMAMAARDETELPPGILPPALYERLAMAYRDLARRCGVADPAVAVRSSAVDEDSASVSFAGQHETFLNVTGVEAVAAAVVWCWQSLRSSRAQEYRRQHGLSVEGARLAVLVQEFIPADVSAVVFSANPVTSGLDEVVINASWGLGESVVGGTVTPDTYVVYKATLKVVERQIADKRRMVVPVPDGTQEVDVPRFLRPRPTLEDNQAVELAELAVALESTMGWPVDLECACRAGQFYLLQCRPVTAFAAR
jgi:phosphoenolpyruvate synthase/pyruvate phosphate dikinase